MDNRIDECQAHLEGTLRDALRALDRGGAGIVLVMGEDARLAGILTDGDIRRALLAGRSLDSALAPHVQRDFVRVSPEAGRAEVMDLMKSLRIDQIPIVDAHGRLIGLHLIQEILGAAERPNWGVIVAGGRGTRLGPITETVPKPMIRVAGRPILERIVLHLVSAGIQRVFIAIHHLADIIRDHFGDGRQFGCRIEYLQEERPLGTGGALSLLPDRPRDPLLVMNGDLITQVNLSSMLDYHAAASPALTLAVRRYYHRVPYGCVEVEGGRVVSVEEKPTLSPLVNAGIYVVRPDLVGWVPRDREYPITSLIAGCLERKEPVSAFEFQDEWMDVGQRDDLTKARGETPHGA